MKKNYALVAALLLAFILVGIALKAPAATKNSTPTPSPTPSIAAEAAQYHGKLVCLPHKNQSGPQTAECALGIQADDGKYYGVRNSPVITRFKPGDRLVVTGRLQQPEANETYGVAGNINATAIAAQP